MRQAVLFFLLIIFSFIQGCAWSIYEDERLMDTLSEDTAISTKIKTALMREHFVDSFSVAVYCFYGNVFLVGEIPVKMQELAIKTARSFHPRSVTPHWFSSIASENERSDLALAATLRTALIGTRGLSSTRIDTQVNDGRVVLLGVVHDDAEKQLAIKTARQVKGVKSVTSYLMIPPKPAQEPKTT